MCTAGAQGAPQPGVCGHVHSTGVRVHSPGGLLASLARSHVCPAGVEASTLLAGRWLGQGARGGWRCGGFGRGGVGGVLHPIKLGDGRSTLVQGVLRCRGDSDDPQPASLPVS